MQLRNPKTRDIDTYIDAELYLEGEGWVPNTSKPGTEKYDRLKAGEFGEVEIIQDTIDELKVKTKQSVELWSESKIKPIMDEYPLFERETWAQQTNEAEKFLEDSTADTPLLSKLVENRGKDESVLDLANAVVLKSNEFKDQMGQILGTRRRLIDQIDAAQTEQDIVNIQQELESLE